MEVASPLPLNHVHAGAKRPYACSPGYLDTAEPGPFPSNTGDCSMGTEDNSSFSNHPFKRRRFISSETKLEAIKPNSPIFSSSLSTSYSHASNSIDQPSSNKRTRTEHAWNQTHAKQKIVLELQRVVDQQATEINRLKCEKKSMENSYNEFKSQHEKISGENRILKKAVTIQQERQNHSMHELQAACKYRNDAEDRIRKLEQMNLNLQYRLQSQESCIGNDFMRFNPTPPDVF